MYVCVCVLKTIVISHTVNHYQHHDGFVHSSHSFYICSNRWLSWRMNMNIYMALQRQRWRKICIAECEIEQKVVGLGASLTFI